MAYGQVNADVIGTSVAGSNLGAGNASIMKNRIINGAMVIDQRNAGASVTPTSDQTYSLDRWVSRLSQASKYSVQQNAGSITAPVGFTNYLGIASLSSYSVGATDYFQQQHRIEGFNVADLNWGTANAKTITISFWVRSSLTGSFGASLTNNDSSRWYPFSYTISSANTWTQISVTIAGDTSGTWTTTNTIGLQLNFGLGVGSTYSGGGNAWTSSVYIVPASSVSVVGTSGATFYITGIQLEVGSNATGFEYVNYQTSLANCQRYYSKIGISQGNDVAMACGLSTSSTGAAYYIKYATTMRSYPTISVFGLVSTDAVNYNAVIDSISSTKTSLDSARLQLTSSGGGMTQYRPALLSCVNGGTGYVDFSAEL